MSEESLKDRLAVLEAADMQRALLEATRNLQFRGDECREATFRLIRPAIKKVGSEYIAEKENLPLEAYIRSQQWLAGMLQPVEVVQDRAIFGAPVVMGENGPVRQAGPFELDSIKPGMSAEDRTKARVAISAELAKLRGK